MNYLDNTPIEDIIDEFGSLKELEKDAKERLEILRAELLRRGTTYAQGHKYDVTVTNSSRSILPIDRVRSDMGEQWVDERLVKTGVTTVKSNRISKASEAA